MELVRAGKFLVVVSLVGSVAVGCGNDPTAGGHGNAGAAGAGHGGHGGSHPNGGRAGGTDDGGNAGEGSNLGGHAGSGGTSGGGTSAGGTSVGGASVGGASVGGEAGDDQIGGVGGQAGDDQAGAVGGQAGGDQAGGVGGQAGGGSGAAGGAAGGGGGRQHFPMPMPNPVETGLPNPHSYTPLGDGTVYDNVTGLTWMVTPYRGPYEGGIVNIAQAREYCAALELGGYDDWRVPSRIELVSIIDYTRSFPAIDPLAFVGEVASFGGATVSEPNPGEDGYFRITFLDGNIDWVDWDDYYGWVRCVRSPSYEPSPRFDLGVGQSAGMVFDNLTGLRWQRRVPDSAEDWQGATSYCENLSLGEQRNFRLPSMKELQTLVREGPTVPKIDLEAFPDTPADAFLTSSPYVSGEREVWNVNFVWGTLQENVEQVPYRVRCVADDDGTPWTSGTPDPCADRTCSGHGSCSVVTGEAGCACDAGFVRDLADPRACVDVDECATNNGGCDARVACVNTPGGHRCRDCPAGYQGSGETGCTPITDCACQNGGTCVEHGAGTVCDCPDGYLGPTCETKFVALALGNVFTCGLRSDGALQCWGSNFRGQSLPPAGAFKAVTAGAEHACAIRADDTLACWGGANLPAPPPGTFRAIAAGQSHTCAVRTDGTLACWGSNASGQSTPPASGTFQSVASGPAHSCAIRTDGTLACWGDSAKSTLPQAIVGQTFSAATVYTLPFSPYTIYTCGLRSNDAGVSCWASSTGAFSWQGTYTAISGRCGLHTDGTLTCSGVTATPTGTFTTVGGGTGHDCAIRTDGTLQCFGNASDYGQYRAPSGAFTRVGSQCSVRASGAVQCLRDPSPAETFADISSNGYFAIRPDGTLAQMPFTIPMPMPLPAGTFDQVESSTRVYALGTDGTLAWRDPTSQSDPIVRPPSGKYRAVAVGSTHQCAIATSGRPLCWGTNYFGQLETPADTFTAIDAFAWTSCAIRQDDASLRCWGDNRKGEATPPAGTYQALSKNGDCAIRSDGTIVCWATPPVEWYGPPPGTFDAIAGTRTQGCAIASDATLHCWGETVR